MSATEFEPVLPVNVMRCAIYPLADGKLHAFIEDDSRLIKQTLSGDNAYELAKQWIKDNL